MATRSKTMRQRIQETIQKTPTTPPKVSYGDIVVFGMANVGKTSIINRFVNNYFSEKYTPTVNQQSHEVNALIQCEKNKDSHEEKKQMVFKRSFKKSVLGKSRPLKNKNSTTMKRVLTVSPSAEGNSKAYEEGKQKGLKNLLFNLVDTSPEMVEMEPICFKATVSNAKGFLLVCSFDVEGSLEYIHDIFNDIEDERKGKDTPIILVANKSDIDIEDRLWEEHEINTLAAQLHMKYCTSSLLTKEGCENMTELMLNEINIFAEDEEYQKNLPEDYAYYQEGDEVVY